MKPQRMIEFSRNDESDRVCRILHTLSEQFNLMMERSEGLEGFKVLQVSFEKEKMFVLYEFDRKMNYSEDFHPKYMEE